MGLVKFKDGTIRYCIYNGVVDRMESQTYTTMQEAWDNFDKGVEGLECEHEIETVEMHTDYGSGLTWESECCKKCGKIFGKTDPYDYEENPYCGW